MEKGSIGSIFTTPIVIMTNPNNSQPTDAQILKIAKNLLDSNPENLLRGEQEMLQTFCSGTTALQTALKEAVLGIFQAVTLRQQEAQRQKQEQNALLRRAAQAKEKVLSGDLSDVLPADLPAIAARLTPEEISSSLWLIVANFVLAQCEEHMSNRALYLYNDPCNTYCFGLRRKFSRKAIERMIVHCGEEAEEKIAFLPPERGSRYWTMISRNSRAYTLAQRTAEAEAEAQAQAQAEARPRFSGPRS
jgi:hypothetical protein